ncbi:galactokinase, partial [candidate division KSB1 bacterium]|nr:galactokinase [candidate division KSB1 bacterium]
MDKNSIVALFQQHYQSNVPVRVFAAPGRVNLIGEHTDYNDGYVFPMALDLCTYVAIAAGEAQRVRVFSQNLDEAYQFSLDENAQRRDHWSDYVAGVAHMLEASGIALPGADLYIYSDVPVGSGLSSSAAIEVSSALALLSLVDAQMDGVELARLCQMAENRFVGMNCGIMDQFVSIHGQVERAIFLDCRSLDYHPVPLPSRDIRVVVCNTMVKHELGASQYNIRRSECEQGVLLLKKYYPQISALRDVSVAQFESVALRLPETVRKRCRHVVMENERTLDAAESLKKNDLQRFGQLMNASHESLRYDYEVSCTELDAMVDSARHVRGCLGARMTGGGFGGC